MMKQLARAKFSSFNLKVPTNWQDPKDSGQYSDALKGGNASVGTPDTVMPPLFTPIQMNKHQCDIQKMHNAKFGAFIDKTCEAICFAWDSWQKAATMVGFVVTGPVATVGKVVGIPWTPLILAQGAKETPQLLEYTTIIATVLGNAWLAYTLSITSPGVPIWPWFSAFPSPAVPPQPGNPVSLMMFTQVDAGLQVTVLKSQMVGMLPTKTAPYNGELFEAISSGFYQCFAIWQKATMLNNIMGAGAVPSCIPPLMPPGPVVGTAFMTPGGFT